jgi:hypothetical protein
MQKLKTIIECVREFAGRPTETDNAKAKAEMERRRSESLTGLTMMRRYNFEDTSPEAMNLKALNKPISERSGDSGSDAERARRALDVQADDVDVVREEELDRRSVAELYVKRSGVPAAKQKELKKEAVRRRRYLWLGGGEGIKNLRNVMLSGHNATKHTEDAVVEKSSPRRTGIKKAQPEKSDTDEDEESPSPKDGVGGAKKEEEEESDSDDGADIKDLVLWNNKKLKSLREAILLAGGPAVKAIGQFTTVEAVLKEVEVLGQKNLDDYHIAYEVSKDLSDLQKLIRYKCGRSWIPRLSLWLGELKSSLDEQRVHIYERRQIHKDCIRHVLQTCERILFSLADLLTWQETAFLAAWSIEEQCPLPPAAKRFLPNRGDIDDDARTPRDEADAIALAPDDEIEGAGSTRLIRKRISLQQQPVIQRRKLLVLKRENRVGLRVAHRF